MISHGCPKQAYFISKLLPSNGRTLVLDLRRNRITAKGAGYILDAASSDYLLRSTWLYFLTQSVTFAVT